MRQFFTENGNKISIYSDVKTLIISCEKIKTNGTELKRLIHNCVIAINGVPIKEFDKYESYPLAVLSSLEECQTVMIDGLPKNYSRTDGLYCKISFDLVFDVMSGSIDFKTVNNIKK